MSFVALFPQPRPRSAVRDELLTKESPWSSKGHSATPKCCQMKLVLDTFPSLLPVFMRGGSDLDGSPHCAGEELGSNRGLLILSWLTGLSTLQYR